MEKPKSEKFETITKENFEDAAKRLGRLCRGFGKKKE